MLARIKKDDLVIVVSGKDKGKQGHIVAIDHKKERVLVKGVGITTRHIKARRQGEKSRISKEESYVPFCKVMPICPSCKKRCRRQVRLLDEGKRVRVCHRCKEAF
jgi:large subunit ribosomal protein L24